MFDYDSLFDSFSPSVDVQTKDLVRGYLEKELLSIPRSDNRHSTFIHDQPQVSDNVSITSNNAEFEDSTSEPLVETHDDNEIHSRESSKTLNEEATDVNVTDFHNNIEVPKHPLFGFILIIPGQYYW